jgi:hypothetical protein
MVLSLAMAADSPTAWLAVPSLTGTVVAFLGWSAVEWVFEKLWWLDWL